ncbi:ACP S-malonyltransferase [Sandaracinus amylolyticus]|uniref:[acyl-carrier-protein] S-malonyltransferase n=1 Tax=Sandaracinus amylolyticus TaxID=927083 RepID=A0A0F6YG29_9BACT|nr:ACP S-malonyltransferase [Sandaracinus amylolyticus]AKF04266.1 Malonyl CoA-acyl carrier protein transacylase [Sandaracinus amylolyticus]
MTIALLFPGQGSEEPEMGLALASADARAARLLALASDACAVDVRRAIERGGRAMTRTEVIQPAIVAVSLAVARALEDRGLVIDCVLGHSLGELTAACFALDVPDEDAIAIAASRGRAMAEAAATSPGGMLACATTPSTPGLVLAAHNAPDEHVLSGRHDALVAAERALAPHARRLAVAGAWHSRAMEPATAPLRAALGAMNGRAPRTTLISALDAREVVDGARAADVLVRGIVSPVRWVDALRAARHRGVSEMIVVAPARVVRSLARRTLGPSFPVRAVATPEDIESAK